MLGCVLRVSLDLRGDNHVGWFSEVPTIVREWETSRLGLCFIKGDSDLVIWRLF